MITCEKCIHRDVCELSKKETAAECSCYKDEERIVELPCKVGDTYYAIERFCSFGGVCKTKVSIRTGGCNVCQFQNKQYLIRFGCDKEFRVVEHQFESVFDVLNKTPLIGNYYFWTAEEAEAVMNKEDYEKTHLYQWYG